MKELTLPYPGIKRAINKKQFIFITFSINSPLNPSFLDKIKPTLN